MASLTIRGLDDRLKSRLRMEAARQGQSMEETARQILRRALMPDAPQTGGFGSLVHGYFDDAGEFDLELPTRSLPRSGPDISA